MQCNKRLLPLIVFKVCRLCNENRLLQRQCALGRKRNERRIVSSFGCRCLWKTCYVKLTLKIFAWNFIVDLEKDMSKILLKGSTILAPLPVVMVTVGDMEKSNIITVAWTGVVCSYPPRVYVSIRHDRYSYDIINKNRQFVINFTSSDLLPCCDYCGIRSGRDEDKFLQMKLTKLQASAVQPRLSSSRL